MRETLCCLCQTIIKLILLKLFTQPPDILMTRADEVFQMMLWYCARLTPSRNTALGSGSFCNSVFFSPKYPLRQRSESNIIGDWQIQIRKTAKIRNRYNQVPHLTQYTNGKVANSQLDITDES